MERLQKLEQHIKCSLDLKKELLRLEGAWLRHVEPRTNEENEAIMERSRRDGGFVMPEGAIEDLMMANLLKD
jgi:hypothetical protein